MYISTIVRQTYYMCNTLTTPYSTILPDWPLGLQLKEGSGSSMGRREYSSFIRNKLSFTSARERAALSIAVILCTIRIPSLF